MENQGHAFFMSNFAPENSFLYALHKRSSDRHRQVLIHDVACCKDCYEVGKLLRLCKE